MLRKTLMSMVAMATFASVPAHAGDPASAATKAAQSALAKTLPFADRQDFDFASRGYLGTRSDPIIKRADGTEVYAPYSTAQMDAVMALCKEIVARHNIRPDRIIGHNDIAPGRKQDPGPLFPWKRFADEGLIAWPDATMVASKKPVYQAQLPDARWFQDRLTDYGFNTSRSGQWDELTRDSMISFQMKYRPAVYDGRPDAETAALLDVATHPQGMRMSKTGPAAQPYTTRW